MTTYDKSVSAKVDITRSIKVSCENEWSAPLTLANLEAFVQECYRQGFIGSDKPARTSTGDCLTYLKMERAEKS